MPEVARFFAAVLAGAVDPISALGYAIVGLVARKAWQAAFGGIGWAAAMEVYVRVIAPDYSGQFAIHRIVGGVIVALLVFGLKRAIKARNH